MEKHSTQLLNYLLSLFLPLPPLPPVLSRLDFRRLSERTTHWELRNSGRDSRTVGDTRWLRVGQGAVMAPARPGCPRTVPRVRFGRAPRAHGFAKVALCSGSALPNPAAQRAWKK